MDDVFREIGKKRERLEALNVQECALSIIEDYAILEAVSKIWEEKEIDRSFSFYGSVNVKDFFKHPEIVSTPNMKKFSIALLKCAEMHDCKLLSSGSVHEQVQEVMYTSWWTFERVEGIPDIKEPEC